MSYNPASIYAWQTNRIYKVGDVIQRSNTIFECIVDHTSGTFNTDAAANKWAYIAKGGSVSKVFGDSPYAVSTSDNVIVADASSGAITLNLYTASGNAGQLLTIKKSRVDATFNAVTIDASGSELINGSLTKKLLTTDESYVLYCDGSNWQIVDHYIPSAPTVYAPAFWLQATTTNPSLGNGAAGFTAYWQRIQNSVRIFGQARFAGTLNVGSGNYLIALPSGLTVASTVPLANNYNPWIGSGSIVDDSAAASRDLAVTAVSGNAYVGLQFKTDTSAPALVTNGAPWVWAANDCLAVDFIVPITEWSI